MTDLKYECSFYGSQEVLDMLKKNLKKKNKSL